MKLAVYFLSVIILNSTVSGQDLPQIPWLADGKTFLQAADGQLISRNIQTGEEKVFVSRKQLTPAGQKTAIAPENFSVSDNGRWVLVYTNSARVWRKNTRGDYWLLNLDNNAFRKVGKNRISQSLMFAKLSPDASKIAYVSNKNLYVEDVASGAEKALTSDGKNKLFNGTFDWAYEEEFFCRDGFRWSPDSKSIAFWQVDATGTRNFYMLNNTDSVYPRIIPIEYPKVGQPISSVRIGVVNISSANIKWMNIPGNPKDNYLVRMEWAASPDEIVVQQLDRKQQQSKIFLCQKLSGAVKLLYQEKDKAWIDILAAWDQDYSDGGWEWINKGKEFIWASEKDGWRHLYRINKEGSETLITKGNFDVIDIVKVDEKGGFVYYLSSPFNATQKYLYRSDLNGSGEAERISPANQPGTHEYRLSPHSDYAFHLFSNYYTPPVLEWVSLPGHIGPGGANRVADAIKSADKDSSGIEFFTVRTREGIEMDAWMQKPKGLNKSKKYPIVFYVYTEPWGQEVKDIYGVTNNKLYDGDMSEDGYLYICIDNRGTPAPKGREWRKSIYRRIGMLNINDQAMAAEEILKWSYVDTSRVAVWGWSGGGTATLNLMFQYPGIYKTGIAIAAVANQLTYDNIYQERYMGDPAVSLNDYIKGSPVTYAKNLSGNLLYIHGTGDDNVHYQNAEMLLNELIRYNKQFQFMAYPNRSHSISEGEGTEMHLRTLYTGYLKKYCPPGGK
jgi:dipeptidyl-peptidase-4